MLLDMSSTLAVQLLENNNPYSNRSDKKKRDFLFDLCVVLLSRSVSLSDRLMRCLLVETLTVNTYCKHLYSPPSAV
jgi:hypothetical protein